MKRWNTVARALLIGIFFAAIIFPGITKLTGLEYDLELYNVSIGTKPRFSLSNYWTGEYQEDYEQYQKTNCGNYSLLVKTYTQLRFSLFDLLTENIIKMDNGSLTELQYISGYLKTEGADVVDDESVSELFTRLDTLKEKLAAIDKDLIILLNPSKLDIYSDEIPLRYKWRAASKEQGGKYLSDYLAEWAYANHIPLVDGVETAKWLSAEGIPAFYNGGTHFSKPTAFWITQSLCDQIRGMGYQVKNIQFNGYSTSTVPVTAMDNGRVRAEKITANLDWDIERTSNLFYYPASDALYYYPQYEIAYDEYHDMPDIFLMGKSYNRDIQFYLNQAGIGNRVYHCQNTSWYIDANFNVSTWNAADKEMMRNDFAESEIIVLEYNNYNRYRSSFLLEVDTLLKFLESETETREGTSIFSRSYHSVNYNYMVRGFFKMKQANPSEDYYWMTKSGTINLSTNGKFDCQSVVLDCFVPAKHLQMAYDEDISQCEYLVYINGEKAGAFPVGNARNETLWFDVTDIAATDGQYCIEIIAPCYFQAREINPESTDGRELALRVYSCALSPWAVEMGKKGMN